jgi:hypothetical protein
MRNRIWVFGSNAGLTFSPNPVGFSNLPINTYEGCASICDSNGNLVLYSDGVKVWDDTGTVRATGLQGSPSSSQAALVVPDPVGNKRRCYVFTSAGASGGSKHVNGVRLDIGSDWMATPLPSIMTMPPTAGFSPTEKLVAIRHANGKDFWVLTIVQPQTAFAADAGPGHLRVFLVTVAGVAFAGDQPLNKDVSDVGYMKASVNGGHLAIVNMFKGNVLVVPFSNATGTIASAGIVTIPVKVPPFNNNACPYGAEFSPSGKLLYFSTLLPLPIAASPTSDSHVFQYVLPTKALNLVGTHPNDKAGGVSLGALQLGPNGRIYIAQDGETKLGVIAQPNLPGAACKLTFSALSLAAGSTCRVGLPNLIRELM